MMALGGARFKVMAIGYRLSAISYRLSVWEDGSNFPNFPNFWGVGTSRKIARD
jgi:hypothetical protein